MAHYTLLLFRAEKYCSIPDEDDADLHRKKQARAYREIIPDEDEAEVRVALVEQQQRRQARSDGVWVPH
eukprot:1373929-Rhodomonas_salina.3